MEHNLPNGGAARPTPNIHHKTVEGFGREWSAFDQTALADDERQRLFDQYFSMFPFAKLSAAAEGFDLGCGSGRWAAAIAPRVRLLHCIDPSEEALAVARRRLRDLSNVRFHIASSDTIPLEDDSQDFGYSLGVLHHIPNTAQALRDCVKKLKPGAPFLLYIYYKMENRPKWYHALWRGSDLLRRAISRLPFPIRRAVTTGIATIVYWPLARTARLAERLGADPLHIPLGGYRHSSFYSMRTDALDRFGTRLEQRFSRPEIERMMKQAGLEQIQFRPAMPYWTALGVRER